MIVIQSEATGRIFSDRAERRFFGLRPQNDKEAQNDKGAKKDKRAKKDKEAQNDLQKMYILGMIKLT